MFGCGPRPPVKGPNQPPPPSGDGDGDGDAGAGPPACQLRDRRLSSVGRGGARPDVAANGGTLGVVWEELAEPGVFLDQLCLKQGSPVGCWRDGAARFETYGSQHFAEKQL